MRESTQNEAGNNGGSVTDGLPKFRIKVPKTLEQAVKLRRWLESILHTLSGKAHRHASNMIYQVKATEDEEDLLREQKQAQFAWQAERLAPRLTEASR